MFYQFTKESRSNLEQFLSNCSIKAVDSDKVALLVNSLKQPIEADKDGKLTYEIDENVAKFTIATLDELVIKAKYAVLMLEVKLALSRPLAVKEEAKAEKKDQKKSAK